MPGAQDACERYIVVDQHGQNALETSKGTVLEFTGGRVIMHLEDAAGASCAAAGGHGGPHGSACSDDSGLGGGDAAAGDLSPRPVNLKASQREPQKDNPFPLVLNGIRARQDDMTKHSPRRTRGKDFRASLACKGYLECDVVSPVARTLLSWAFCTAPLLRERCYPNADVLRHIGLFLPPTRRKKLLIYPVVNPMAAGNAKGYQISLTEYPLACVSGLAAAAPPPTPAPSHPRHPPSPSDTSSLCSSSTSSSSWDEDDDTEDVAVAAAGCAQTAGGDVAAGLVPTSPQHLSSPPHVGADAAPSRDAVALHEAQQRIAALTAELQTLRSQQAGNPPPSPQPSSKQRRPNAPASLQRVQSTSASVGAASAVLYKGHVSRPGAHPPVSPRRACPSPHSAAKRKGRVGGAAAPVRRTTAAHRAPSADERSPRVARRGSNAKAAVSPSPRRSVSSRRVAACKSPRVQVTPVRPSAAAAGPSGATGLHRSPSPRPGAPASPMFRRSGARMTLTF
eukprot:Rhum_TRINITY_DN9621_c0_g1::Rhum_TRINITY_DN9621_c0_g1_i1::g.34376::m.34376